MRRSPPVDEHHHPGYTAALDVALEHRPQTCEALCGKSGATQGAGPFASVAGLAIIAFTGI